MSNCSASCTSVRSPLIAAIATFALKADVWFRRGLLLMLSPDSRASLARCQAEAPLIALCRFPKPALGVLNIPHVLLSEHIVHPIQRILHPVHPPNGVFVPDLPKHLHASYS